MMIGQHPQYVFMNSSYMAKARARGRGEVIPGVWLLRQGARGVVRYTELHVGRRIVSIRVVQSLAQQKSDRSSDLERKYLS